MKDLIIGCATRYKWDNLKNWIKSINQCGFTGDKVLIVFESDSETVKAVENEGFKVVPVNKTLDYKSNIPVHVERFVFIYHYLKKNEYRYVITTDVKDVIFQTNPSEYLEKKLKKKKIVIGSESMLYKNEPWGDENLIQTFGRYIYNEFCEKEIFNVGTFGGEYKYIKDLVLTLFTMSTGRPIPIVDQAVFNYLMHSEPWSSINLRCRSEDGWAAQLGTTGDPIKINNFKPHLLENTPDISGDIVKTSTGLPFCIVHQYDRVPSLKQKIDKRYE